MSNDFHSINKHLPEMQLQLKRSTHLRLKLKYDDLYERLIWGKKIVHTFGTLGNLTFRGLFEAFLGYFFYMNEQQINQDSEYNHNAMKHVIEEYGSRQFRLLHNLENILYYFWLARLLFISLMYLDPETFPLYEWDYGSGYFWKYRLIFNKFFLIILIFIVLDGMLGMRTYYFQDPGQLSFQVFFMIVFLDTDENIAIKCQTRYNYYRQQFNHNHPILSMINPLADRLVSFKVWLDSWLKMDLILYIIAATISTLLQCMLLLSCTIIAASIIYHFELNEINENFQKILNQSHYNNGKPIKIKDLKQLRFILEQHTRLTYYLMESDQNTWSKSLFYYALVGIPINVTFICELLVEDLPTKAIILFILIALSHTIASLIPFMLLALISYDFHKLNKHLPSMQLQLKQSKQHLRLKLKYDDLYGRLIYGKKIAHTFGTFGNLTFRGLFEAFFGYFVAFFLILGFYMDEHQINQSTDQ
ncbi:hypothetical protein DERP_013211 [Dermatophagoides pteronyssinus]|uniref:Gustatory receptor n=1 Tax=Dermatophagoides pteronyssinus TaxID=6956 RepID=A0ABQ8J3G0_DERPT|nr:hypothetical protein DERP_013211 [Dermatophagoides pteronyssinus]